MKRMIATVAVAASGFTLAGCGGIAVHANTTPTTVDRGPSPTGGCPPGYDCNTPAGVPTNNGVPVH